MINRLSPSPPQAPNANRVTPREEVDPQIRQAAEGMEAMFLDTMMRAMRQAVPEEGGDFSLENAATKLYRGMLDSEYSQMAAKRQGVGLAEQVIAYLQSKSYHGMKGNEAPSNVRSTGGTTHEGQSIGNELDPERRSRENIGDR